MPALVIVMTVRVDSSILIRSEIVRISNLGEAQVALRHPGEFITHFLNALARIPFLQHRRSLPRSTLPLPP